ncbi:FISUMP domain-containing protein [Bacteroidota bacterium]
MKRVSSTVVFLLLLSNGCEFNLGGDPPVAVFTVDRTIIMKAESVQFTDRSGHDPTSWNWDFGDGNTSSGQSPLHAYTEAGTFSVSLTVTNEKGSDTYSRLDLIRVSSGSVTDKDGNTYKTVIIGQQEWMAENLKVTHFPDGNEIPFIESNSEWDALQSNDKAYSFYDNSSSNGDTYGALYTWAAAMNGSMSSDLNPSGVQGACPEGWHIPSEAEWIQLINYLGWEDAGGKLKETGTTHWDSPNEGASNESGFTGVPGGVHNILGFYDSMGMKGSWWSSTESNVVPAWRRSMYHVSNRVGSGEIHKATGLSVRCLRDQ